MINDFPREATTIRFQGNVNKFYVTSRKEKKIYLQKNGKHKQQVCIWRGEFEIEYLLKYVLTLKFNIYENKHISIQLPEL